MPPTAVLSKATASADETAVFSVARDKIFIIKCPIGIAAQPYFIFYNTIDNKKLTNG